MGPFATALRAANPARTSGRRWVFVAYDQLNAALAPQAGVPAEELGLVLVESPRKAKLRPYHRQKLALVLANLRQFALEQARRGVAVRHVVSDGDYAAGLAPLIAELGPLTAAEPAERELRADLAPLVARGALRLVPHEGWLTDSADFAAACPRAPWRMDAFYRHVRRRTGVLMDGDAPVGGRFSFDGENRRPWRGEPPAPEPPRFTPDAVTREVAEVIEQRFAEHPGRLDLETLPATAADAEALWRWARSSCLPWFGPFEDAMSSRSRGLFHTRVSPLLNLQRLLPATLLRDVLAAELPLASCEGFVRQLLGWREFVRHVHRATDGFRRLPEGAAPLDAGPGDGGWSRWSGKPWRCARAEASAEARAEAGAAPSHLDAHAALPPAFWGRPSGLNCLDRVVADVWHEGWSHHITRLMVLGNLATLLGVEPRELSDWFWVAYVDAFDWVVEPNVLGMATFGIGAAMTTKPYVCGGAYLDRMSDYCAGCAFDPRENCPITRLYWSFLARNAQRLGGNPRLFQPLGAARRRSAAERDRDAAVAAHVAAVLAAGGRLTPEDAAFQG